MFVSKGLRLALKSVPSLILVCKAYLGIKASFFLLASFPGASENGVDLVLPNIER